MALPKNKITNLKSQAKVPISLPTSPSNDPNFTGKEKAILDLARTVVQFVFILIGGLFIALFLLTWNGKEATTLKDITSAFIAVASGILGSILGYYYKGAEK